VIPSQGKLNGLVKISEEHMWWIRGELVGHEDMLIELSFEAETGVLPGTHCCYMAIWHRVSGKYWFEFQLGVVCVKPTEEHFQRVVKPLIERLQAYRPLKVDNRSMYAHSSGRHRITS
jgi:hypothetical protein